jgi:hypothetical protein
MDLYMDGLDGRYSTVHWLSKPTNICPVGANDSPHKALPVS